MLRRLLPGTALAGLATVAACDALTTSGAGLPVAIVTLSARTQGAGFTTAPTVNFFRVNRITFSSTSAASDSCAQYAYDPNAVAGTNTTGVLGGGAFVLMTVSGHTDSLKKATTPDATYRLASTAGVTFTPGDSIRFVVPGDLAGFPAVSVSGRTAEPYTLSPIIAPPPGQAMTINWSAATDNNAAMLISLRFNNGTGTGLNAELSCDFHDRGVGTVQAALAAKWVTSSVREVYTQRLRTALVRVPVAFEAWLNLISTFDVPTPVSP